MKIQRNSRLRRATKTRAHIRKLFMPRLSVHRTNCHIYAQVISPDGGVVLASASTLQSKSITYGSNKEAAAIIGKLIAERALAAGCKAIAFDRSGFKFHGRIKALADAARAAGLEF